MSQRSEVQSHHRSAVAADVPEHRASGCTSLNTPRPPLRGPSDETRTCMEHLAPPDQLMTAAVVDLARFGFADAALLLLCCPRPPPSPPLTDAERTRLDREN